MNNPYLLKRPGVISFSGGRTSAYMLYHIIRAFNGQLPNDVYVLFCNTGKEREETLQFVEECSGQWDVPVIWLEYRYLNGCHTFEQVNFATASRNGEPFEQVIAARAAGRAEKELDVLLPYPVARYCTAELKQRTKHRYLRSIGLTAYFNAIGFRADEEHRVLRATVECKSKVKGETLVFPLHIAGVGEKDLMDWWASQPFDLQLRQHEGNCDLCFLKSKAKILEIMYRRPDLAAWWIQQEELAHTTFRRDRPSYSRLLEMVQEQSTLFPLCNDDLIDTCQCTD